MGNGNGLYQWIANGLGAGCLFLMGIFQVSRNKALGETKDDVRALEERSNNHGEAIAAIEANAASQHETLQRQHETLRQMDKKLDENWRRVDKKLDRLLHE